MSFSAIIPVGTLSDALSPIHALVDECKIRLTDDGLSIRVVDPANVAMADVSLDAAAFESYDADGGVIGLNLERLTDVLSMGGKGDLVSLTLNEETRKLDIHIDGLSYTLALIDIDTIRQEPDLPELELPATVVLTGDDLDRGIKAADLCSGHITLRADKDGEAFHMEAVGDTDDVDLELGNDELLSAQVDADAESLFSLDYLRGMSSPMGNDTTVSVLLGTEFPVKLRYSLSNGHVEVQNMLAPRISSE